MGKGKSLESFISKTGRDIGGDVKRSHKATEAFALDAFKALRNDDIIAINLPPDVKERRRIQGRDTTNAFGDARRQKFLKRRFTMQIESEPVIHDFRSAQLGNLPANAIGNIIAKRIRRNAKHVSDKTTKARVAARRAWDAGRRPKYITDRYVGGRIGDTPPNKDNDGTYGYDSGRLADNLFTRHVPSAKEWTINTPANRLRPQDFSGGRLELFIRELSAIMSLATVTADQEYQNALGLSMRAMIGKLSAEKWKKQLAVVRQVLNVTKVVRGSFLSAVI